MEVVNHPDSATLSRSRAAPAHLSNAPASGCQIARVRVVGDEADELQTLLIIPYFRGLGGERFHLDHRDGAFHFFKYTPMAYRPRFSRIVRRRVTTSGTCGGFSAGPAVPIEGTCNRFD